MPNPLFLVACAVVGAALGATFAASEIRRHTEVERAWLPRVVCAGATSVLFATVAGVIGPQPQVLVHLYLAAMAVPLAVIDLRTMRLPHRLTVPMYPATVLLVWLACAPVGEVPLTRPLAGMAAYLGFHLALALGGGLGGGDVVLAGPLGLVLAWHGWLTLLGGILLANLFGLIALTVRRLRRRSSDQEIPYGPAMLAGALTAAITA